MQQAANLGDGNGSSKYTLYHAPPLPSFTAQSPRFSIVNSLSSENQTAVIRWNYGDPQLGSCRETIEGGNHFRYWVQDGKSGNSGAVFLAASVELPISRK